MSDDNIVFETESSLEPITTPKAQHVGLLAYFQKKGWASSREEAIVIVSIVLIIIFGASFFLIKGSLPEPASLGEDVLRPGEAVPAYVK